MMQFLVSLRILYSTESPFAAESAIAAESTIAAESAIAAKSAIAAEPQARQLQTPPSSPPQRSVWTPLICLRIVPTGTCGTPRDDPRWPDRGGVPCM